MTLRLRRRRSERVRLLRTDDGGLGPAGVSLPHNAAEQTNHDPISESQLQPGDLIYFLDGGSIGHVGIWIGDGMLIDAPHSGATVREISLANMGMTVAGYSRP